MSSPNSASPKAIVSLAIAAAELAGCGGQAARPAGHGARARHGAETQVQSFIALCQARGITPALMTQANRFTPTPDPFIKKLMVTIERDYQVPYDEFRTVYDAFNEHIREVGRRHRVLVIDLDRAIPKTGEHLFDYIHYNDSGSTLAAQVISRSLAPLIKHGRAGS